jgi:hypothetical protein
MNTFNTEQEAFTWLYELVNDECIDNERFAFLDDAAAVAAYETAKEQGCCGSWDEEVTVAGRAAWIGCNYGH